jgi:hypothetical protein
LATPSKIFPLSPGAEPSPSAPPSLDLSPRLLPDFICVVPRTSTWKDVLTADIPIAPRLATLVVYFCFWPCLLGYCFEKMSPTAYFRQLGGGRVLLRSLAANYEARVGSTPLFPLLQPKRTVAR